MKNSSGTARRFGAAALATSMVTATVLLLGGSANAGIVPTVPLATAAEYSVLAGSTVTNTGPSVLNQSLGLSPGTSVTGFPPGTVNAPGVQNVTNAAAAQAKLDLTAAYNNAAGRPTQANTAADLANLQLQAGVYAVHSRGAMSLTGPLVLDGAGNKNSVFIFQTNSSLTFASSSTVSLINGAQECNVFWQVGSSATLGSSAVVRGNIMADQSITVNNSVTVYGRAMARIGAVTLDNDTFVAPGCDLTPDSGGGGGGGGTTADSSGGTGTTGTGTGTGIDTGTGTGTDTGLTNGAPPISGPPRTGGAPLSSGNAFPWIAVLFVTLLAGVATTDVIIKRRTQLDRAIAEGDHGDHGSQR